MSMFSPDRPYAMTFAEIARELGDDEANIRQTCYRALRKLRRRQAALRQLRELRGALIQARREKEAA